MGEKQKCPRPVVLVDTREQLPYKFDENLLISKSAALTAGDYTLEGMENVLCIERKNLNDLVQSLIKDRKRFFEAVKRMKDHPFRCLVAECTPADIASRKYRGGAHPESVLGALISFSVNHGIPIIFAGDRQHARWYVQRLLLFMAQNEHLLITNQNSGGLSENDDCNPNG